MALFEIGLLGMFFFVLCSNVLNYVAIATTQWLEDESDITLWGSCYFPGNVDPVDQQNAYRPQCFKDLPPALIATGTALNCLSLFLMVIALLALVNAKFRKRYGFKLVIISELATLLSLLFNSTGWYFLFNAQYQNVFRTLANNANSKLITPGFRFGWSFWLLTGSFGSSVLGSLVGSSFLGCTYIKSLFEYEGTTKKYQTVLPKYMSSDPILTTYNYRNDDNSEEIRF